MERKEINDNRAEMAGERIETGGMFERAGRGEEAESESEEERLLNEEVGGETGNEGAQLDCGREDSMEVTEGGVLSPEGCVGKVEVRELGQDCGEGEKEMREDVMRRSADLEEREQWPCWLKDGVDMLHEGERGKELESILVKFVRMERALGFKGEKTVS